MDVKNVAANAWRRDTLGTSYRHVMHANARSIAASTPLFTLRLCTMELHTVRARKCPTSTNVAIFFFKRILKINILVGGSNAITSPSISLSWHVLQTTVLPMLNQSLAPAIFDCQNCDRSRRPLVVAPCDILWFFRTRRYVT